jgi:DNA helicase-4
MYLNSNTSLFYLLDKWRGNAASLTMAGPKISVAGGKTPSTSLSEIIDAPKVERKWLGSELSIKIDGRDHILRVRGSNRSELDHFAHQLVTAWRDHNWAQLDAQSDAISYVVKAIAKLEAPTGYPAACYVQPILESAQELETSLFSKLNENAIGIARFKNVKIIRAFLSSPGKQRSGAIEKFEQTQLKSWSEFFDSFETNPLTPEQRLAIVADEDATLVLAGAGSGKTSVITAKAGYLLKAGIRKPEEILLLAFARDAAAEMSERIEQKCGEPVEARTFHALSYDIIGHVEGGKPALAAHATDNKAFLVLIRDILIAIAAGAAEASKAIINWFTSGRLEAKSEWDFKQKHDYYTYLEKEELRTLQGDQVKSYEELLISNWLYENGVEYEYEPDYEFDTSNPTKRNYCPDFRLTESGVYLEHFGVRKMVSRGEERLETAPWVDRDDYLEGMEWKRQVHKDNETTLLETFSYERQEGRLLDALAEKVAPHVTLNPRPPEALFDRVMEMNDIDGFVQLLANFLRNYKSGGYTLEHCAQKADTAKLGKRAQLFLTIFRPVFEAYEESLKGRIDFEDMVLRAAQHVESGRYKSPFGHILIDEFQDISRSRARLVKALLGQKHDTRLFAVGDDWQSIYRFAGSDIHLMRNFGAEFGGNFDGQSGVHRTVDLGRTFRSVDKIAFAARKFILKNPTQLTKTVIPAGTTNAPAIKVIPTFKHDGDMKLENELSALQTVAQESGQRTSILLLGRYRHSEPNDFHHFRRKYLNLDITFKTIHSSKGLEADHVILLQAFKGQIGFPSEIVDDPLLTMVSPEAEPFEHAEERRVMYVAMTRARKTLTIMGSAAKPSVFVEELLEDAEYGLLPTNIESAKVQTCGECQGHLLPIPKRDGGTFYRCEHVQLCGNILPSCPGCGVGFPVRVKGQTEAVCDCKDSFSACPVCADGWLVERKGRFGKFLGCVKFPRCTGKAKVRKK